MCGIVGIISNNHNASAVIFEGLKKLEYRGYDSWGIAVKNGRDVAVEKHIGKIGNASISLPESHIGIGHTRWATHGGVTEKNAHPHSDCSKKIVVVHNGIVENYQELKNNLHKKHHFSSETDTEIIAHLIEEKIENYSFTEAVLDTFALLMGSNAIVVFDIESETIMACRNGSPLVVGLGNDELFLGSDVTPFLSYTNRVVFLNDGEAAYLKKNNATFYNTDTKKEIQKEHEQIDWQAEDAEKKGFPHYMIKEIMEQTKTIENAVVQNKDRIVEVAESLTKANTIGLIGCGTAYYACLFGQYFFAQNNIQTHAYAANEFEPFKNFFGEKSIIVAVSQSGETADTLIAVRMAKKAGAKIISLVNARGSTLERLSDICIPVQTGPEIAVVSTKAFTAQTAVLYGLSYLSSANFDKLKTVLHDFSAKLTAWLSKETEAEIISLTKQLIEKEHVYLIGKHAQFPAALEAALKIKETSYIHAEGFAAGELKHGVITLVQHGTPCIVLAENNNIKQDILASASEVKSRGGTIIGVAPFSASEFDIHLAIPDCGDLTALVHCIAGQLIGYYLGIGRGTDPDKPRNLAKSVTVK